MPMVTYSQPCSARHGAQLSIPWARGSFYPCFMGEQTEAQRDYARSHVGHEDMNSHSYLCPTLLGTELSSLPSGSLCLAREHRR